jgi:hypothetical protein
VIGTAAFAALERQRLKSAAACSLSWLAIQVELLDLVPVSEGTLATPEMQPAD